MLSRTQTGCVFSTTGELLDNLEQMSELGTISSEQEFSEVLRLPKAIMYFLVDWSGPERISRPAIYRVISEINLNKTPFFKVDCSDQRQEYIMKWLTTQPRLFNDSYHGGWGETLLLKNGFIVDYIKYPGKLGLDKTRAIIENWVVFD